jgi:phytoene synthase
MSANLDPKIADFAADWLQREPTLALCYRFAIRPTHWLTSVLVIEELLQGMFALSNQDLAQAKLGWWADEADLTVSGAPRHPLTKTLVGEHSDVRSLPDLARAAYDWITLPTATDVAHQRSQLAEFAAAASALVGEGECAAIWAELALKRQIQSSAKSERYGPGVLSRAVLAEFQLKASQLHDPLSAAGDSSGLGQNSVAAALSARLRGIALTLQSALQAPGPRMQSATRAYALLHAGGAQSWAKSVLMPQRLAFLPAVPGIVGVLRAWWIARASGTKKTRTS